MRKYDLTIVLVKLVSLHTVSFYYTSPKLNLIDVEDSGMLRIHFYCETSWFLDVAMDCINVAMINARAWTLYSGRDTETRAMRERR